MSQVAISGNASGTGTLTIAAPNTNSNYTLTLPSATTTFVGTDATQTLTNKTIQGGAITSGTAVASTSGTSIDFTGLPSWIKKITVMFSGVSTSGTSYVQVQLGTGATTYTTSGYDSRIFCWTGGSQGSTATSGILIDGANSATATASRIGSIQITNLTGNTWVANGVVSPVSLNGATNMLAGNIALGAVLTAVRITTVNGTDTFDAGTINILYEG